MTKHNQNVEQLIISSNKNKKQQTETQNKMKKPKLTIIAENKMKVRKMINWEVRNVRIYKHTKEWE